MVESAFWIAAPRQKIAGEIRIYGNISRVSGISFAVLSMPGATTIKYEHVPEDFIVKVAEVVRHTSICNLHISIRDGDPRGNRLPSTTKSALRVSKNP